MSMNDENSPIVTEGSVGEEDLTNIGQWLHSAKSGTEAFDHIYDFFFPKIYNYVSYKVGEQDTAEDITADTFMRVISKFDSFAGDANAFTAWIYRIARNLVTDFYRLSGRKTQVHYLPDEELANLGIDSGSDVHGAVERKQKITKIREAINTLKPQEQELITLRFFEGLDSKSIGDILDIKPATINVQLHRAVEKLKKIFEGQLLDLHA